MKVAQSGPHVEVWLRIVDPNWTHKLEPGKIDGMYELTDYPLREGLIEAHEKVWENIAGPGPFWTGAERIAMVAESRTATSCLLCAKRRQALSPYAVDGVHDSETDLDAVIIDMIHRIRSDPGRLTRNMFDQVMGAGITPEQYIEIVGVVNSSVIIDTLHAALGLPLAELPTPQPGAPTGQPPANVTEAGAWVPIAVGNERPGMINGLSDNREPNIARSMGLVPNAVQLFFTAFRPHYALQNIPLELKQSQAEFIASRVSALNQCFY